MYGVYSSFNLTHTYTHTHTCTAMHKHKHTHVHTHMRTYTHMCTHSHAHTCQGFPYLGFSHHTKQILLPTPVNIPVNKLTSFT